MSEKPMYEPSPDEVRNAEESEVDFLRQQYIKYESKRAENATREKGISENTLERTIKNGQHFLKGRFDEHELELGQYGYGTVDGGKLETSVAITLFDQLLECVPNLTEDTIQAVIANGRNNRKIDFENKGSRKARVTAGNLIKKTWR